MSDSITDSAGQIGCGIRKLRKQRRWKQDVLAEKSGLSRVTISLVENAKTNVSTKDLLSIAHSLDTTIPGLLSAGSDPLYNSNTNMKITVAARVRFRREYLGLSRHEVGVKVGLLPQYLSTTENGTRLPLIETILKLAIGLGVKPSWILGEGDLDPKAAEGKGVDYVTLAKRMRIVRNERDLSRDKFGRQIGLSPAHIYQLETGRQKPTVATLTAFCSGANIPYSVLLDEEE